MTEPIKCPACDRRLAFLGETGTETRRCVCGCKVTVEFGRQVAHVSLALALALGEGDELQRQEEKR